jgi:hypothetical protein
LFRLVHHGDAVGIYQRGTVGEIADAQIEEHLLIVTAFTRFCHPRKGVVSAQAQVAGLR